MIKTDQYPDLPEKKNQPVMVNTGDMIDSADITDPHLLHNQTDQFLPKTDPSAEKILVSISGISLVPDRYDYELPYTCASFWWNAW